MAYSNPRPKPGLVPSPSLSCNLTPIYLFVTKASNKEESDSKACSDTLSVGCTSKKSFLQEVIERTPVKKSIAVNNLFFMLAIV
jgi:hypothetical protein